MNFSEELKVSASLLKWSPNCKFLAVAIVGRLEIRDGMSLQLLASVSPTFGCYFQALEWSADSSLFSTACYKRGIIEIWNPLKPSWRCSIDERAVGIFGSVWSPDSRHILTIADLHLRVTVWSLVNKTVNYINNPKNIVNGLQFSHDGQCLAVAKRIDCKDVILIVETDAWSQVKEFQVSSRDLAGFSWSPDDSVLAIWDSSLEYKVLIYTPSGHCLSSYSAYELALGVKSSCWSPSSQLIAIGSYDNKIRLMNHITWKIICEFEHFPVLDDAKCSILNEVEKSPQGFNLPLANAHSCHSIGETKYEVEESRPVTLLGETPKTASGVTRLAFSSDGRFLASKVDSIPNVVWIWNIAKLALSTVLVHNDTVKDFGWSSSQSTLAICTGGNQIYLWTSYGCLSVAVPNSSTMKVSSIRWDSSGSKFALIGKENFSVCFLKSDVLTNLQDSPMKSSNPC